MYGGFSGFNELVNSVEVITLGGQRRPNRTINLGFQLSATVTSRVDIWTINDRIYIVHTGNSCDLSSVEMINSAGSSSSTLQVFSVD